MYVGLWLIWPKIHPSILCVCLPSPYSKLTEFMFLIIRPTCVSYVSFWSTSYCRLDVCLSVHLSVTHTLVLYTLRTSECCDSPVLPQIDATLRDGLSRILQFDLSDDNWLQASLPVKNGGLGIRSVTTLAPSAFLASAASTLTLQDAMLAQFGNTAPDLAITRSTLAWSAMTNYVEPMSERKHIQKAWDGVATLKVGWGCHIETAKFSAAEGNIIHWPSPSTSCSISSAGDWLHAAPISSIGLRLSNEAIRVAVGRLG